MPAELGEAVEAVCGSAPVLIAGDAACRAASLLSEKVAATRLEDIATDCGRCVAGGLGALRLGERQDAARPLYLRPPQVTLPKARPAAHPGSIVPLRIESVSSTAVDAVSMLHRACFPDEPWDAGAIAQIMRMPGFIGRIAWQNDIPAGLLLALDLGEEIEILSLCVVPESSAQWDRLRTSRCSRARGGCPRRQMPHPRSGGGQCRGEGSIRRPRLHNRRTSPQLLPAGWRFD